MLTAEHINCSYGKKQVLFDVSLSIGRGDIALLIGSNGSGKSTLLKCLYKLKSFTQDTGAVFSFDGRDLSGIQTQSLLKTGLAYIPQSGLYYERLTVRENLAIPALNDDRAGRKRKMEEILALFPVLASMLDKRPAQISGGERQLMNLAAALQHRPAMLLMDEPFNGLSAKNLEMVRTQLTNLHQQTGCTILMIEHRIMEALPMATRLFGLKLGRMMEVTLGGKANIEESITAILI